MSATSAAGIGGAISVGTGTLVISNSTLHENTATGASGNAGRGGAIGTVEGAVDFPAFGVQFNTSGANVAFDFNNDGIVDGAIDFPAFGARFNQTL